MGNEGLVARGEGWSVWDEELGMRDETLVNDQE